MASQAIATLARYAVALGLVGGGAVGTVVYVSATSPLEVVVEGPPGTSAWLIPLDKWEEWSSTMPASESAAAVLARARVQVGPQGRGTFPAQERTYVLVADCSGRRVYVQQVKPSRGHESRVSFSCP